MNGILWDVERVRNDDPRLVDRTGHHKLATTDPSTLEVCISEGATGPLFIKVLVHEVGHCSMISYGLLPSIRRFVRDDLWWEAEEWLCNYLADYGRDIMRAVSEVLGHDVCI